LTFQAWAELKSWSQLSTADAQRGNLNYIDSLLPHESEFIDQDCRPHPARVAYPPHEIRRYGFANPVELQHFIAARCALKLVADYFRWMREQSVYDNTMIVVVSDHGIAGWVDDRSTRAIAGKTQSTTFVRTRSLLLVKPIGAHGTLAVSDDFLPNAEVPRLVCTVIGGCVNPFLGNRPIETAGRDDPFVVSFVPWQFSWQEPKAFKIQGEMVLSNRDPYVRENWRTLNRDEDVQHRLGNPSR
jgi:hypothetical protein